MSTSNISQLSRVNWRDLVQQQLSHRSRERIASVSFGYEGAKNGHFIYVSRKDGEVMALPVDSMSMLEKGMFGLSETDIALLVLFLG